jgi:hypothetical protein
MPVIANNQGVQLSPAIYPNRLMSDTTKAPSGTE